MEWNICVVSDRDDSDISELNNALLYGSRVIWIPRPFSEYVELIQTISKSQGIESKEIDLHLSKLFSDDLLFSQFIRRHLNNLDRFKLQKTMLMIQGFQIGSPFSLDIGKGVTNRSASEGIMSTEPDDEEINKEVERQGLLNLEIEYFHQIIRTSQLINDAHASIMFSDGPNIQPPQKSDMHQYALELMNAMQRMLLPDISHLPIDQIKELQVLSKDELEPMRIEMLGLTKDLREMLDNNLALRTLTREAENLIATRLEPTVRAVRSRVKSDIQLIGKSRFKQGVKAICLLCIGRLSQNEKLVDRALTEFGNLSAEAISDLFGSQFFDLDEFKEGTPSSRFVVRIAESIEQL